MDTEKQSPDTIPERDAVAAPTDGAPPEGKPLEGVPSDGVATEERSRRAVDGSSGEVAPGPGPTRDEKPEIRALKQARDEHAEVEGKVIGWNRGGFHVVVGDTTAFCPRSEMELGSPRPPEDYLDQTFKFQVLKVQKRGRRVVLSRTAAIKKQRSESRAALREKIQTGAIIAGRVASLTGFGAFVDIGSGIQGLVHISEISHQRIDKPEDVLEVGQEVSVKVLKVEKGGKRISLSMRALEDNPWNRLRDRYPPGVTIQGRVQRTTRHGVVIELEPGLTGLLPASALSLPPDASLARAYPPGREVSVQIMQVDERRHRISLALEGSALEGTWHDFQDYRKQQHKEGSRGFNALANALKKAHIEGD